MWVSLVANSWTVNYFAKIFCPAIKLSFRVLHLFPIMTCWHSYTAIMSCNINHAATEPTVVKKWNIHSSSFSIVSPSCVSCFSRISTWTDTTAVLFGVFTRKTTDLIQPNPGYGHRGVMVDERCFASVEATAQNGPERTASYNNKTRLWSWDSKTRWKPLQTLD